MKYTYYVQVTSDEHLFFAHEIAEAFNKKCNLDWTDKELTSPRVHAIIKKYCTKYSINNPHISYNTKAGLRKVYDFNLAELAINEYLKGTL